MPTSLCVLSNDVALLHDTVEVSTDKDVGSCPGASVDGPLPTGYLCGVSMPLLPIRPLTIPMTAKDGLHVSQVSHEWLAKQEACVAKQRNLTPNRRT